MPARGPGSARTRSARRGILAVVVLLAGVLPAPPARAAAILTTLRVAPTCAPAGVPTRMVILGTGWGEGGTVTLSTNIDGKVTTIGTASPRTSPVRQQPGSFSFTTTASAVKLLLVTATQGQLTREAQVSIQSTCPQVTARPQCLSGPGTVVVSGTGFVPGPVPIEVDPYGAAEAEPQQANADPAGRLEAAVFVPFKGGPVPIVVTRRSAPGAIAIPDARFVVFVDPCPPVTTTTSTTRPKVDTTARPGLTTTTVPTLSTPPPVVPPPEDPPVTIGPSAQVSISPRTVRPGRCSVIVVSSAPAALPVTARFADGPPVSGVTGPGGGTVLSVCQSHDSGAKLGPVKVLIGIGPAAPVPVFTVLRVPARPQPPLLQSGADGRRS